MDTDQTANANAAFRKVEAILNLAQHYSQALQEITEKALVKTLARALYTEVFRDGTDLTVQIESSDAEPVYVARTTP